MKHAYTASSAGKSPKKRIIIIAVILLAAVIIWGLMSPRQSISYELEGELCYVVSYAQGGGPKRLNYAEHKELLDDFLDKLTGDYKYSGRLSVRGLDGSGGVHALLFYNNKGEMIDEIRYHDGFLCVTGRSKDEYYLYSPLGEPVPFDDIAQAAGLYGVDAH